MLSFFIAVTVDPPKAIKGQVLPHMHHHAGNRRHRQRWMGWKLDLNWKSFGGDIGAEEHAADVEVHSMPIAVE